MIPSFGVTEMIIILAIVVLLFGAKRVSGLARSMGTGLREFRKGVLDRDEGDTPNKKLSSDKNARLENGA